MQLQPKTLSRKKKKKKEGTAAVLLELDKNLRAFYSPEEREQSAAL